MDFSLLAAMIFNLFLSSAVTDSVSFVRLTFSDVFFSSFLFIYLYIVIDLPSWYDYRVNPPTPVSSSLPGRRRNLQVTYSVFPGQPFNELV